MTETLERLAVPPRDSLRRTTPFAIRAGSGEADDGLTLDGYAAVFNRQTVIDSWEGRFKEEIAPGAMKKSFRENPPRVQFDHGHHPLIGSIPIASVQSVREEVDPELAPEGGAHVIARMLDNWLVQPVRDAIANESINGMSFRFSVVREAWRDYKGNPIEDEAALRDALRATWDGSVPDKQLPIRTLQELRVPELGPVVWPAYADTSVGVRDQGTLVIDLGRLRDPAERHKLAQAVLMADRAVSGDSPQLTTEPVAEEHEEREDDDIAADHRDEPAEKHESAVKADLDLAIRQAHHTLTHIAKEARTI